MGIAHEHEIHKRRLGRNLGLGIVLGAFVVLIFALTMAKLKTGEMIKGYDYERPQPAREVGQ